jgi:predicted DNA-binding transcriptional regulator YafY
VIVMSWHCKIALSGDILRFGADVEVVGPAGLRSKVQKQFLAAAARYV